jgi:hypothetical protein
MAPSLLIVLKKAADIIVPKAEFLWQTVNEIGSRFARSIANILAHNIFHCLMIGALIGAATAALDTILQEKLYPWITKKISGFLSRKLGISYEELERGISQAFKLLGSAAALVGGVATAAAVGFAIAGPAGALAGGAAAAVGFVIVKAIWYYRKKEDGIDQK